jgi:hypothetical protein
MGASVSDVAENRGRREDAFSTAHVCITEAARFIPAITQSWEDLFSLAGKKRGLPRLVSRLGSSPMGSAEDVDGYVYAREYVTPVSVKANPTSLPWAKIPGPPKVPTTPLPDQNIVKLFWNQCQHQSWYFAPWHRGYLLALEAQVRHVVVALGGPKSWALPYWDYLASKQESAIPPAFTEAHLPDGTANPLFVNARFGLDGRGDNIFVPTKASVGQRAGIVTETCLSNDRPPLAEPRCLCVGRRRGGNRPGLAVLADETVLHESMPFGPKTGNVWLASGHRSAEAGHGPRFLVRRLVLGVDAPADAVAIRPRCCAATRSALAVADLRAARQELAPRDRLLYSGRREAQW